MPNININDGTIRLTINDDPSRVISFNPADVGFATRFYELIEEFDTKRQEYHGRALALDKQSDVLEKNGLPVNGKKGLELLSEMCEYLRGSIDRVFGDGTSKAAFGDANTLTMFEQFFDGISPFIVAARQSKTEKYLTPSADVLE